MDPILKKNILEKILAKIPDYLNPADFLYEVLNISKESVYRRLKGDVSFTLDDLIILSSKLSFSLDEILFIEKKDSSQYPVLFHIRSNKGLNPQKKFSEFLSSYIANKDRIAKAKDVEVTVASNRLMILSSINYEHIFKFYYYKWVHQTEQKPLNYSMSDVTLSDDIIALRETLLTYKYTGNHIYILDSNFLKNTLTEVQYYYRRKLISEEEIILLQNDFLKFVDTMEYIIKQERVDDFTNRIYISTVQIDSTGLYCRSDNEETLDLWLSFGTSIHTTNAALCDSFLSWINALKKYSILITGCDEASKTQFIDKQRDYIKTLTSKDYIYE
ncbi:hypothetical protein M2451_000870 [Dysgonomonas sp. PFB1-18]|uniref:hypothetical protein n=1 Tax=unclassified Dysgonomonas TaxID=2630389 RepID=UPI0024742502|nr:MULTISPECIES: hypothetical protein [unclassified Dysgonomonas]MDH6308559.1 hypothetical protein [Dysgonomonas sp. PF1-14]MDH6338060.1 hypothetical protein [Dysgonomonas sp. PF1-16]MDH6379557.1 hypothetical protein [Dysgonomonas sp. PFB1-18]MDH6396887.1 hypothetical protein [Dysgonomonas sp. PF1-23]